MIPFSEFSASREKREKPVRKGAKIRFLVPGILWGLFFLSLGYFFFFSRETTVREVSFFGNETISLSSIEAETEKIITGRHLHVFPKNNFFFIPKSTLISGIEDISPKIQKVTVGRTFPEKMSVFVRERPVVIVWRSTNGDFLLNESGYVSSHPNLSVVYDTPFSFFLYDEAGRETIAGDMVTERNIPMFIGEFVQKFESRFEKALSHEVRISSRFSGELLFHVEEGFDILLDSHMEVETILVTLQAAMERGIAEEDRKHLERIDLRTENRVYYTLRVDVPVETNPSQEVKAPTEKKK